MYPNKQENECNYFHNPMFHFLILKLTHLYYDFTLVKFNIDILKFLFNNLETLFFHLMG